jgi:hypothetical protein
MTGSVLRPEVASDGTITQQSGGISSTPGATPLGFVYCLHVPGTPHVAVATPDGSAEALSGTFEVTFNPGSSSLDILIAAGACGPTTNIAVLTEDGSASDNPEAFNLLVD